MAFRAFFGPARSRCFGLRSLFAEFPRLICLDRVPLFTLNPACRQSPTGLSSALFGVSRAERRFFAPEAITFSNMLHFYGKSPGGQFTHRRFLFFS